MRRLSFRAKLALAIAVLGVLALLVHLGGSRVMSALAAHLHGAR